MSCPRRNTIRCFVPSLFRLLPPLKRGPAPSQATLSLALAPPRLDTHTVRAGGLSCYSRQSYLSDLYDQRYSSLYYHRHSSLTPTGVPAALAVIAILLFY